MRFAVVSAILAAVPALALQVTSPSASDFWVAESSNVVAWTTSSGDPVLVDITLTNVMNDTLQGPFAIAQNVPVGNLSFTFSNVTLVVADGYVANLVSTTNLTQVFASSQQFSVKPNGTAPPNLASITAPGAAAPSSTSPSSGNSSANSNGNSTANTTASVSGSSSSNSPSASKNASLRTMDGSFAPVFSMLALTVAMTLFGAVITL